MSPPSLPGLTPLLTTHALIKRSISNQNTVSPLAGKYRQVFQAVEGKKITLF